MASNLVEKKSYTLGSFWRLVNSQTISIANSVHDNWKRSVKNVKFRGKKVASNSMKSAC